MELLKDERPKDYPIEIKLYPQTAAKTEDESREEEIPDERPEGLHMIEDDIIKKFRTKGMGLAQFGSSANVVNIANP